MSTVGIGQSAYLDVPGYLRATTNQETASLLGLNTQLGGTGAVPAGTVTLPVVTSTSWIAGPLWLLDGPYAEVVMVTGSGDGTHLTLAAPGTLFAHNSGVSASQAGTSGSLAETILRASSWIEGYCQQGSLATDRSLYAVSRNDRWGMPSTRATLDRDGVLQLRPGHFPVQAVTALAIEFGQGQSLSLDVTQIELPSNGRYLEVPYLLSNAITPGQQLLLATQGLSRSQRQWATLTYTGGLTPGQLPYDVQHACELVVSEFLSQRRNPTGAALLHQGKLELQARPRLDTTGDSILLIQAKFALASYRNEMS